MRVFSVSERRPKALRTTTRLMTIIGALSVLASSAGTTAYAAAPSPAAGATAYQNMVISKAMAHTPGGTRVAAGEVVWTGGIFLAVPATENGNPITTTDPNAPDSKSQCPFGDFCGWSEPNFSGCLMGVPTGFSPSYWGDWGDFSAADCGSQGTRSWFNDSDFRGWKEQHHSGGTPVPNHMYFWTGGTDSGDNRCISPGNANSNVTDTQNADDGWMQGSTNASSC